MRSAREKRNLKSKDKAKDTHKERVDFVWRHWDEHYDKGVTKTEDSDMHMWVCITTEYIPDSSTEAEHTPHPTTPNTSKTIPTQNPWAF